MNTYFVTFGCGSPLAKVLLEISAPDETTLREKLVETTKMWCSIKSEFEFDPDNYCKQHGTIRIKAPDFDSIGN